MMKLRKVAEEYLKVWRKGRTKFLEQRRSWKSNSSSAGQKILRLLWIPDVNYDVYNGHKSAPLGPILSRINPIGKIISDFSEIQINIIVPYTHKFFK